MGFGRFDSLVDGKEFDFKSIPHLLHGQLFERVPAELLGRIEDEDVQAAECFDSFFDDFSAAAFFFEVGFQQ